MSTSVVVEKLSGFLQQGPTDFEITILPTATTNVESKMLSIDDSIVLVDGKHLGLDARSLPWITREIRRDYKRIKQQQLQHPLCTTTNNPELLLQVTSCLLLVNPDHATAWADRRRCTLTLTQNEKEDTQNVTDKGDHTYWHQELKFLNLLMTQHSKA